MDFSLQVPGGRQEMTSNLQLSSALSCIPIDRLTSRHDSFSPLWGASTPLRTHCHCLIVRLTTD